MALNEVGSCRWALEVACQRRDRPIRLSPLASREPPSASCLPKGLYERSGSDSRSPPSTSTRRSAMSTI